MYVSRHYSEGLHDVASQIRQIKALRTGKWGGGGWGEGGTGGRTGWGLALLLEKK